MEKEKEEIEQLKEEIEELKEKIEDLENGSLHNEYDDFIDEEGAVKIGNLTYYRSQILKNIDEIAYDIGYNEYIDEKITELNDEIGDKKNEIQEKL